jgi:hypothetical protein
VSGWGFSTTRNFHPTRRADRASASPSRGGRSTWKRHGKTRGILTATRDASGLCRSLPPFRRRERRAEKRNPIWCRVPLPEHASASRAPHALKQRSGSACYLRRFCEHRAALSSDPHQDRRHERNARSSRPKAGSANQSVSQLLAGTLIGPGRSPGAARVPDLRDQTRRRAPHPATRTPHECALRWTR